MEKEKIKSVIESILFTSGEEIGFAQLVKILEVKESDLREALGELTSEYEKNKRGIIIVENNKNIQLVTNPENALFIEKTIKKNLQEALSRTALEVLSIVAYRGPVSRSDIESIRGVNSSFTLRNLLMRGLIVRNISQNDQRGYLYNISLDFIKKMGLNKIEELPNFTNLSKDQRVQSIVNLNVEK